jgi:hypothetical protein
LHHRVVVVVVAAAVVVVVNATQVEIGDDVVNENVESVKKKSKTKGAIEERRRVLSTENEAGASHHWRRVITRIGDDITGESRDIVIMMANMGSKESTKEMAMRIGSENTEIFNVQPQSGSMNREEILYDQTCYFSAYPNS